MTTKSHRSEKEREGEARRNSTKPSFQQIYAFRLAPISNRLFSVFCVKSDASFSACCDGSVSTSFGGIYVIILLLLLLLL